MDDQHRPLFDLPDSADFSQELDAAETLENLFENGQIALRRGRLFDHVAVELDLERLRKEQRIEGMLLGVAVGDALGHSTEWKFDPGSRYERFGTILDHLSDPERRPGRISDDAQMTFWTADRLLSRGQFDFDDVVGCFVDRKQTIVGMGANTGASLERHRRRLQSGSPSIHQCAGDPNTDGRGNGALMRFSPIVLPHLRKPSKQLWNDATMCAFATHGHTAALANIGPMTCLLWDMLGQEQAVAPKPTWWIDRYVHWCGDLETQPLPFPLNTNPIPKWFEGFRGTLCDFIDGPVRNAFRKGVPLRDACSLSGFGSRADIVQTAPAVLYTLMCHADSFESSIIAAVNDTKDNDTIAAIVGAIVGALFGKKAIRRKWINGIRSYSLNIDGRTSMSDREVMEELADRAVRKFVV